MPFESAASSGDCCIDQQSVPITSISNCDSNSICINNRCDTTANTAVNTLPVVEFAGNVDQVSRSGVYRSQSFATYGDAPNPNPFPPRFPSSPGAGPLPVSPGRNPFPPAPGGNPFPRPDALRPDANIRPGDQPLPPGPMQPAPMIGSFTAEQVRHVLADRDRAMALNRGQKPDVPSPGIGPMPPSPDGKIPYFPRPDAPPGPSDIRPRPERVEFDNDMESAKRAAIESKRPLIISFSRPNCGACDVINSQAWPNQTELVNDNAVRVKVDGSRNRSLAQQFNITGYPTTVVVDPTTMREYDRARGAVSSGELSNLIQRSIQRHRGSQ